MTIDKKLIRAKSDVFKAFGHPTRLYILQKLCNQKECCVLELVKELELEFSIVSKHLSILRENGLIKARKDGLWKHYTLRLDEVRGFIDSMGDFVAKRDEIVASEPEPRKKPRKRRTTASKTVKRRKRKVTV